MRHIGMTTNGYRCQFQKSTTLNSEAAFTITTSVARIPLVAPYVEFITKQNTHLYYRQY